MSQLAAVEDQSWTFRDARVACGRIVHVRARVHTSIVPAECEMDPSAASANESKG
jgi:hypothetical protein